MHPLKQYYEILEVKPSSSLQEINQAYINLLNRLRSDRTSNDPLRQQAAQTRSKEINEAYAEIKKAASLYRELQDTFDSHIAVDSPVSHTPPASKPISARPQPPKAASAPTLPVADTAGAAIAAAAKATAAITAAENAAAEKAAAEKAEAVVAAVDRAAAAIASKIVAAPSRTAPEKPVGVSAAAGGVMVDRSATGSAQGAGAWARIFSWARLAAGALIAVASVALLIYFLKLFIPAFIARGTAVKTESAKHSTPRSPKPRHTSESASRTPDAGKDGAMAAGSDKKNSASEPTADMQTIGSGVSQMPADEPPAALDDVQSAAVTQAEKCGNGQTATIRQAAERGDVTAQGCLGSLYVTGTGVPQDYGEAARWYRKAAERGVASAQVNVARLYASGKGVAKDMREAVKWYRKAANQGDAEAQRALEIWTAQ